MLHDQDSFLVDAIYSLHINIYLHLYNFIQNIRHQFYKKKLEFLFDPQVFLQIKSLNIF